MLHSGVHPANAGANSFSLIRLKDGLKKYLWVSIIRILPKTGSIWYDFDKKEPFREEIRTQTKPPEPMIRSKAFRVIAIVFLSVSAAAIVPRVAQAAGLVPCGDGGVETACTLCHFITGISNIILIIRNIMLFIGLAVITAMGVVYVISAGDEKLITLAKGGIKSTLIGIIVILFAWFIVNMIMFYVFQAKNDLGVGVTFKGTDGFTFQCSTISTAGSTATGTYVSSTSSMGTGSGGSATCTSGRCATDPSIINAINNNSYGISGNVLLSIIAGGEGCNKSVSTDGNGSCGYGQLLPENRTKCGITGTAAETCTKIQNDIALDMNCSAWLMKDNSKRCGTDIENVASCWNTGSPNNCARSTNNYCGRVKGYYDSCK